MILGARRVAAAIAVLAALSVLAPGARAEPASGPAGEGAAAGPPPELNGYKMENYRSPTPLTLTGARVVTTREAQAMWRDKAAVFVDTMPRDRHPPNLPPGTVWRDKPRDNIPGSAWLVNVGYGALSPEADAYFRAGLAAITGRAPGKPLVFYCMTDCWMSWNAAKRALEWGYRDVVWYPEGADGWERAGAPLESARPYEASQAPPSQ